ncbi:hypothetical protein ACFQV2_07385 [Actinokineospora soli]|uniref:HEAT repeat-containing protein n=1 Tax=Actinokineospora soli TaxID=1048753 RepID=A0ABW2TKT2_9PSEU
MWQLTGHLTADLAACLRDLVGDERFSGVERAAVLGLLRDVEALVRLRDAGSPVVRWAACVQLRELTRADRAACVRVLHAIAVDEVNAPALRWRVARELLEFGSGGRELAVPALLAMVEDAALPSRARASAAREVADARPDLRGRMVRFLQSLRADPDPSVRLHVLRKVGPYEPRQAAIALRELASDRAVRPGLRLRAALAAHELRRDFREAAAVVARDIARDEAVAVHIRVKAARALAQRSDLCRAEAQELFVELMARLTRR